MKKIIIGTLLVCSLMRLGRVCEKIQENNYEKANQLAQELMDSDDDNDGYISIVREHGFFGYEVEFLRSYQDDAPELYTIGF